MTELLGKNVKTCVIENIKNYQQKGLKFVGYLIFNSKSKEAEIYANLIGKNLTKLGIEFHMISISNYNEAKQAILDANKDESAMIFVCRPLLVENEESLIELIDPNKDPDMLTSYNLGKLAKGDLNYLSGTSMAVRKIIEYYNINLTNKKVLVLGRSISVGLPICLLVLKKNAFLQVAHSKVDLENISSSSKNADVIILATGKQGLIKKENLNSNQIIIDCGYHENGSGDLNFVPSVNMYTPVPNGVGPVTISCLIENAFFLLSKK